MLPFKRFQPTICALRGVRYSHGTHGVRIRFIYRQERHLFNVSNLPFQLTALWETRGHYDTFHSM